MGSLLPHDDRHPRDHAAPADRHYHEVYLWQVLQHLKGDRSLPGDHVDIVIGLHIGGAALPGKALGGLVCLLIGIPDQANAYLEATHLFHLGARSSDRAKNVRLDAPPHLGRISHAQAVIPSRTGDDAARSLRQSEQTDLVQCATNLERAGRLQTLALEPHVAAGVLTQVGAAYERRRPHKRRNALSRLQDRFELQRSSPPVGAGHLSHPLDDL